MSEELNFVKDLAIILISAGIFTIICKALKQPAILGYILAGFLISPNLGWFGVSSSESVRQWSDIGIIFMMFGLGLEFSFKKLLSVGSRALMTAGSKFLGVFVTGFIVGQAMSWTVMESIFLAGLLSMSSTVVVIKSYGEMGLMKKPYAGIVFGTLVVEDLIAILLMVLLSTMAISHQFSGGEMLLNLAKLLFFLILWFVIGIYVIPTLLKKTKKYVNDEILLIVSLGLCFGMVSLATASGFSSALGAFMMGSILSETIENEKINKLISPIKDLFGAVFFVSVGMMIAPEVIAQHWVVILVLSLVVVVTHILFASTGVILSGGNLDNAVHTGFSLAQLGEFGFIIASVGVGLGVMRDFTYPVIIAVSVITIFTTPYYIKLADPACRLLRKKLPKNFLSKIDHPEQITASSSQEKSDWKTVLSSWGTRLLNYSVILTALLILSSRVLDPLVAKLLPSAGKTWTSLLTIGITLLIMSPFIYGMGVGTNSVKPAEKRLMEKKKSNMWPLLGLALSKILIATGFVMAVIARHIHLAGWVAVLIVLFGVVFFVLARHYFNKYDTFEKRFISNLNYKEEAERQLAPVRSAVQGKMKGYDVHIEEITVSPDSVYVGRALKDLPLRSESGANIIKITRGTHTLVIPGGGARLYPYDKLLAVGTTKQISLLRDMMDDSVKTAPKAIADSEFKVVPTLLGEDSFLTGKRLGDLNLRDAGCMIISVMHDGEFLTNPRPETEFQPGDTVWLAGDTDSLGWL